jgi:sugar lactone lactonase YvrE
VPSFPFLRTATACLIASACSATPATGPITQIVTFAGTNSERSGFADGPSELAKFDAPEGLALDAARRYLYIADSNNHAIRRVDLETREVVTIAGVGGQSGLNDGDADVRARFHTPRNLALSADGARLYVTDAGNFVIRAIDLDGGHFAVTTVFGTPGVAGTSDGIGTAARFGRTGFTTPWTGGLAVSGDVMYVADSGNQTIRSIDLVTGMVSTIAGVAGVAGARDGATSQALFHKPAALAVDARGDVWVTEANNIDIRRIAGGNVLTMAGDAPEDARHFCENISPEIPPECGWRDAPDGRDARFRFPFGVALDEANGMFVVDSHSNVLRRVDLTTTAVTTIAGVPTELRDDIPRASSDSTTSQPGTFSHPTHVVYASPDTLYVSDRSANCIRRVVLDE